jgi:hypothetical protein
MFKATSSKNHVVLYSSEQTHIELSVNRDAIAGLYNRLIMQHASLEYMQKHAKIEQGEMFVVTSYAQNCTLLKSTLVSLRIWIPPRAPTLSPVLWCEPCSHSCSHSFLCRTDILPRLSPLWPRNSPASSIADSLSRLVVVKGWLRLLLGALPNVGTEFGLP